MIPSQRRSYGPTLASLRSDVATESSFGNTAHSPASLISMGTSSPPSGDEAQHREYAATARPKASPRAPSCETRPFSEDFFNASFDELPPASPAPQMEVAEPRSTVKKVYWRLANHTGRPLPMHSRSSTPPPSPAVETKAAEPCGMTEEVYLRAATLMGRPLHIHSFNKTLVYRARFPEQQAPAIVLQETLGHYDAVPTLHCPQTDAAALLPYVGLASFTVALLDATRNITEPRADAPRVRAWMKQLS